MGDEAREMIRDRSWWVFVGQPEEFIVYLKGIKDLLNYIICGLVVFWS